MLNRKVVSLSWQYGAQSHSPICALYVLEVPGRVPAHQALEQVLPGLKWLTFSGFLVGALWSIMYGRTSVGSSPRFTIGSTSGGPVATKDPVSLRKRT